MAVELEEVSLFALFTLDRRTVQIREEQLAKIPDLAKDLQPIPIDPQKLQRLGFQRYPTGMYYKKQGSCEFLLRPLRNGVWEFVLDGGQRIRTVAYIHQVQRLWFALFDDHLFLPKTMNKPPATTGRITGAIRRGGA